MSIHNNETRASYGKIKGFVCPSGATWHVTGLIIGGVVGVRVEDEGGNTTSLRWERGTGWIERGTGGKSNKATWMWILGAPQPTTEETDTMSKKLTPYIATDTKQPLVVLGGYRINAQGGIIRDSVHIEPGKDYGCDPMGDGMFRMVPSGDIVAKTERDRRLN